MRVSGDRQEAWLQVTTLARDIGEVVTWVSNYGGQESYFMNPLNRLRMDGTGDTATAMQTVGHKSERMLKRFNVIVRRTSSQQHHEVTRISKLIHQYRLPIQQRCPFL